MSTLNEKKLEIEINKMISETALANKKVKWYELMLFMTLGALFLAAGKYLL